MYRNYILNKRKYQRGSGLNTDKIHYELQHNSSNECTAHAANIFVNFHFVDTFYVLNGTSSYGRVERLWIHNWLTTMFIICAINEKAMLYGNPDFINFIKNKNNNAPYINKIIKYLESTEDIGFYKFRDENNNPISPMSEFDNILSSISDDGSHFQTYLPFLYMNLPHIFSISCLLNPNEDSKDYPLLFCFPFIRDVVDNITSDNTDLTFDGNYGLLPVHNKLPDMHDHSTCAKLLNDGQIHILDQMDHDENDVLNINTRRTLDSYIGEEKKSLEYECFAKLNVDMNGYKGQKLYPLNIKVINNNEVVHDFCCDDENSPYSRKNVERIIKEFGLKKLKLSDKPRTIYEAYPITNGYTYEQIDDEIFYFPGFVDEFNASENAYVESLRKEIGFTTEDDVMFKVDDIMLFFNKYIHKSLLIGTIPMTNPNRYRTYDHKNILSNQ